MAALPASDPLLLFHAPVRDWFTSSFGAPTRPQALGWPAIARGESTLILAPTGSGKTLTAFLWCLDALMFPVTVPPARRCRVLYVSPLKALAVDVERNLRAPLAGIAEIAATRGDHFVTPVIGVRSGDTPAAERARFQRQPPDILITTPESLYLLLTSNAREALRSVETVIVDEIHALVPTKRGTHLALSLERLAVLTGRRLQRIGLSATQRPLDEVARFLGGIEPEQPGRPVPRGPAGNGPAPVHQPPNALEASHEIAQEFAASVIQGRYRPVTVVDAGTKKTLALTIEVPVEDMARLTTADEIPSGPSSVGDTRPSIWSAIHPRLLELIRTHRSTLIFVNSRRVAERLAGALNELAGDTLVRSHHGSLARPQRVEVEELLKAGALRGLVATSSLELGIDMGAIDLVVQVEAPPSVASGLQRIGRSGHQVGSASEGIIFPKFRGDLLACAAVTRAMHAGEVEATRYPRNPLDIVAQQIVAMTAVESWDVDRLFAVIRSAAPFAELSRTVFEGVLDMLSGRYPSDEFAELRPRVTWDRTAGTLTGREGAKHVAIANGGTIPDRGLYGVFLAGGGEGAASARVGELDEEMVFESRPGETFVLGASSWRIEEITHDRVLVSPAPGEPGKMPFWKGDRAGRPLELGLAIGRLTHDLLRMPPAEAVERLTRDHDLDQRAATNLLQYLRDQARAAGAVPDAATIVVERVRDDLGDWRVCVLSPRGGRIHAPWAMAAAAKVREETGMDVETLWGDDGFVVRFPDIDRPPEPGLLLPDPDDVQSLVVRQLGATALFAAKFRENAARSLLLPKRRAGMRAPLWQQRKRSADLLAVASRYGSFPVLLETYRECLRDFFDMPALVSTLTDVRSRAVRVVTVDTDSPSPFAASLLFSYVANFLYDGDAPLAERRAQALAVDQGQLRELLGDAELRELLDAASMDALERELQRVDPRYQAKSADGIHDMLLAIGDLTEKELGLRLSRPELAEQIQPLLSVRRLVPLTIAGEVRLAAVEDAAKYRDALGVQLPPDIPPALLEPAPAPLAGLLMRFARTHAAFLASDAADRFGLSLTEVEAVLVRLREDGRLFEGEFRPGGQTREWVDAGVFQSWRRRSLAKLRHEIEPVDQQVLGRFTTNWQNVIRRRSGTDALLDAIAQLQGAPIAASLLETDVLPARVDAYNPGDLDTLAAAGEVIWAGVESLGERDGRIALYLADQASKLMPPPGARDTKPAAGRESAVLDYLRTRGASFFGPLHEAVGGGYPAETVSALWNLVWTGLITNDTFHALRAYVEPRSSGKRRKPQLAAASRPRRLAPPSAEGRWTSLSAVPQNDGPGSATAWAAAVTQQLLARHGVLTRESLAAESLHGGFATVYPVLKAMEERGRVRRGYFVAGLGATQFALPGAVDRLRALRAAPEQPEVAVLAATDCANPYGSALKWPPDNQPQTAAVSTRRGPTRTVGATVILVNGALAAYLAKGDRQLLVFLPEAEPERSSAGRAVAQALLERSREPVGPDETLRGMLIQEIDGRESNSHPFGTYLVGAGFVAGAMGFQARPAG